MHDRLPLVVFSHLRWDFVYQRPQHVLSRMAADRRVIFVEEPMQRAGEPSLVLGTPTPNVLRCVPHVPATPNGFDDEHLDTLATLLNALLAGHNLRRHVAWLYTPMALRLARTLAPEVVVYDCMDELASFLGAPPALLEREAALLEWADLVFTGGPSLYRSKRDRHPSVHCFPSSVDVAHFRRARDGADDATDQAHLPHPRLGFFGVIDERLDRELVDALAAAHPEWQVVMVGPVVKIDPATLPRRPNLHYLGQRGYEDLPSFVAGWDVCLLPFALNEATRFISPTKTLEYMAAERPIVSTPIRDVADPYGDIVYLGDTPRAFIAACERALAAPPSERHARAAAMRRVVERTSWDATVRDMAALIDAVPGVRRPPARAAQPTSRSLQSDPKGEFPCPDEMPS